jgi:hypothetical protein
MHLKVASGASCIFNSISIRHHVMSYGNVQANKFFIENTCLRVSTSFAMGSSNTSVLVRVP